MDPVYERPFKVVRKNQGGAYVLQTLTGELLSKNYAPSQMKLISQDTITDPEDVYKVESLVDHKENGKRTTYRIRWHGYASSHDTWEPASNIFDKSLITKYWRRRGQWLRSPQRWMDHFLIGIIILNLVDYLIRYSLTAWGTFACFGGHLTASIWLGQFGYSTWRRAMSYPSISYTWYSLLFINLP